MTIDTLRADRIGAYGWTRARTPTMDRLAERGTLFEHAYAAAPITLASHASLLTGLYPPGHGSRDNGMRMSASMPTIATALHGAGFRTAAFVAAFPLDHQFGLARGFDTYGDQLPRLPDGRLANERPAARVVDDAVAWLRTQNLLSGSGARFFLWVHFFEPHAPYGDATQPGRSTSDRYDDEIAIADREAGRLIEAVGAASDTMIVVAGDHGEAFGEHGEYAHSVFVYDTTLRVPLLIVVPGGKAGQRIGDAVSLVDVAPTVVKALGAAMGDVDGVDLAPALEGRSLGERELYAESFAPLVEFGWAPLRSVRSGSWKYIAAPRPELYDISTDAAELQNMAASTRAVADRLDTRASRYSGGELNAAPALDAQAADRLRALGYVSRAKSADARSRPDPKDRREIAARIAQVTSGELSGTALVTALEGIVREDPQNAQAHLRLGYERLQAGDCRRAETEFHAALSGGLPSADAYLGLATCLGARNDTAGAADALESARRLEPDNPVVTANLGILEASRGNFQQAITLLTGALGRDPDLHEARFNLALAYARAGRRGEATGAARELLQRLPPNAPQRAEVERLLRAVQ